MNSAVQQLLMHHRDRGVAVDTNLFLLWMVGTTDESFISRHKRTVEFDVDDFRMLRDLLSGFSHVVTTPNVLTEVGNLGLKGDTKLQSRIQPHLVRLVGELRESYFRSADLVRMDRFSVIGLTDCALLRLARQGRLVLTIDFALYSIIQSEGGHAINFNHIRTLRP